MNMVTLWADIMSRTQVLPFPHKPVVQHWDSQRGEGIQLSPRRLAWYTSVQKGGKWGSLCVFVMPKDDPTASEQHKSRRRISPNPNGGSEQRGRSCRVYKCKATVDGHILPCLCSLEFYTGCLQGHATSIAPYPQRSCGHT